MPSRVAERRETVAELYPGLSTTEIAARLGCSQSTVAGDVKALEISAPVGPRRKHPKPEQRSCEECGGLFTPKDSSQDLRGFGKLCSEDCKRRRGGRRAATARHDRADAELERLNAAGYLSTRQVAAKLKVVEGSVYRYPIEIAERRLVEGEWLRLVRREELERFERDDWPAIRRRHTELRRQDIERGWPSLPSTWGGRARQRHLGRAHATKAPAPGGQPRGRERATVTEEQRRRIKLAHRQWGRRRIANEFGLSERTVRNVLDELRHDA